MPGYRADDSIGLLSLGGEFASPILDPLFTDVRSGGSSWSPGQQSAWEVRDVTFEWAESDQYLALTPDAWDGGRYGVYYGPWRVGIPVSSGELWRLEWNRFRLDADGELFSSVNVQFFREDGSEFWLGTVEYTGANSSSRQELEFTVPDGAVGMRPYWVLSSDGIRMGIADPVMTRLVDDELPAVRVLQGAAWEFEERQESTNRLEVTVPLSEARDVKTKDELTFQGRRFVVDEVDRSRASDEAVIVADEAQVQLSQIQMADWTVDSWRLEDALLHALEGTGWTLGDLSGDKGRFARFYMEDVSVLEALKTAARHQDARVVFDSMLRRVNIVPELSDGPDRVFTYGSELSNIERAEEAPTLTEIRPVGEDGLTIASVNDGSEILEDYSYWTDQGMSLDWARSHFRMNETWEDNRYTVAENLMRDAQKRLAEESHPKINITLSVAPVVRGGEVPDDLADLIEQAQGCDLSQLHLGDQVWVWDQETETKIRAEVKVVKTSSDASQNEVELGYLPDSLGQGVEGRYRGDSGRPDDGPGGRPSVPGSGPQPRPSMPILEGVSDLGVVTLRWNGQDHEGSYDTIPERFGDVSVVGAEVVDGVVPSPTSEDAFGGGSITNRGGGLTHISAGPGEFAFWFYMVGQDGTTRSEFSEPLIVDVEALVDTEWIRDRLDEAEGRIDEAEQEFRQGQEDLDGRLGDLDEREESRHQSITSSLVSFENDLQEFRDQWDEAGWDPERLNDLEDRQDSLSDDLARGLDDLDTSLRDEIATAGGNRIFRSTGGPEPLSAHGYALLTTPGAGQAIVGYDMEGQPDQPVAPGGEVELSWVKRTGQGSEEYHQVALVFLDSEGSQVGETHTRDFPAPEYGDGDECRTVFTAPEEGATHVYFAWQVNASEPGWGIEAPSLRVDGEERLGPLRTLDERPGEIRLAGMELRAPSREAVEGDRWEQWDTLSTGGKLLATWRHDGEQWVEEELDETYIPQLHIGQGTYGDLSGDRLTAHSVSAQHLQVGSFENLFPDPSFRLFRDYGTGEQSPWRYVNGDLDRYEWDSHDSVGASLLAPEGAGQAGMEVDCGEVRAGEKMSASFTIRRDSGTSSGGFQIWARHRDEDGSLVSGENVTLINSVIGNQSSTQETYTLTWDTPDDPSIASLWIYFRMTESLDGNVRISDPYVRRMVDGEVIIDGSVKARSLDVESLTASEAFLDQAWVNLIQARLLEADEALIGGALIRDNTIDVEKLRVGPVNIITDPEFATLGDGDVYSWRDPSDAWYPVNVTWSDRPFLRLSHEDAAGPGALNATYGGNTPSNCVLPCDPGDTFRVRFQVLRYSGWSSSDDFRAQIRWADANGAGIGWSTHQWGSASNQSWVDFEAEAPEGAAYFYLRFRSQGGAAAARGFGNVSVQRMAGSDLIVDGAITARKVDTEEFFSNEAVIETIWSDVVRSRLIESEGIVTGDMIATGAVTARTIEVTDELIADLFQAMEARIGELFANSIEAMEINAGQVTSGTFVGRNFRTNPDPMDRPGSGGGVLIENRPDGPFRIYDQDGSWTVVLGGSRHQMRDIEVAELHLTGEIRVGRNGEGALMPAADGRLRMEGRIPDTALGPRDTIVQGTTDFVTTSGGSMRSWDLAYPAPTPAGVRMPVVSANISNQHTSPDGLAATSTQARTAEGFRVWTQPLFSSGSVRYAMTYIGVWGFQTSA